jgi:hypothetical protein
MDNSQDVIFLDCFDVVSDLRGKNRTYEKIKKAILKAGRFSCFDVQTKKDGKIFTDLGNDPEIEFFEMGYPWTGVRRRGEGSDQGEYHNMDVTTKAKCRVCGKITAIRQPYGEGTDFLPRRHYIDGVLCVGSLREAELIDIVSKPNRKSKPTHVT